MCWLNNLYTIRERRSEKKFAPLGSIVAKVLKKGLDLVLIMGPGLRYIKTAKKVTKFSNSIKATTSTAGMLLEVCGGKYTKYSVLCTIWAITTAVGLVSGNPTLIAVGLEVGNEILEDFSGE